jgi:hypothetical protein
MPYDSVAEAEKKNTGLKKYSGKAKRGWLSSFNKCMEDSSDESKCFAIAYSVANKVDGKKASIEEDEEGVEHNDKYECPSCGQMAAARELLQAGLDLQDVEPKIASTLIAESRKMMAESRGTVEFIRNSAFCRKMIGKANLSVFTSAVNSAEQEFLRDLRLACEQGTSFLVEPNDITHSATMVASYQNTPGVEIIANITMIPDDRRWNILEIMKKKGYRIR